MFVASLLALAGLALLTVAADHLVLGASRVSGRLRISPVVVGVVVIGLGTSAPEFLVSGVAAARGDTGIAAGNLVGSNILNVTLVLGVAALVAPVTVRSSVIGREVRLAVVAVAAFAVAALVGLSWITGAVLAACTVAALALLIGWARRARGSQVAEEAFEFAQGKAAVADVPISRTRPLVSETVRAVLGLVGVLIGAQLLVANASSIAERLGVPQIVIGVTLVAIGTSLPELVTTVMAQRRGETDLVVGNLFGSNMFNSFAGGAVISFAGNGSVDRPALLLLAAMLVSSVVAVLLLRRGLGLTRFEGAVLLGLYALSLPAVLAT